MSRRYCDVCGESHNNGSLGMCSEHLQQEEAEQNEAKAEEATQFKYFMDLDKDERWEKVFDFMRSHGWDGF
jgi:hypothetical protein